MNSHNHNVNNPHVTLIPKSRGDGDRQSHWTFILKYKNSVLTQWFSFSPSNLSACTNTPLQSPVCNLWRDLLKSVPCLPDLTVDFYVWLRNTIQEAQIFSLKVNQTRLKHAGLYFLLVSSPFWVMCLCERLWEPSGPIALYRHKTSLYPLLCSQRGFRAYEKIMFL